MRRRPGLWLTLGALAAGVMLLGAASCGSSDNSADRRQRREVGRPCPTPNGGAIKIALAGNVDYLDPALAYYQIDLADRVLDLRQADELPGPARATPAA